MQFVVASFKIFWVFSAVITRWALNNEPTWNFLCRLGKTPTEVLGLLQQVYGNEECQDVEFSSGTKGSRKKEMWKMTPGVGGRQQAKLKKMFERMWQKVRSDRRLTIRIIANELSMNSERVWTIITEELRMKKICKKMVPRLLTDEQKERRVQVCQDILTRLETDSNLLGRTITGWRVMDLRVWSIHQATGPWVEESNVTKAKESEDVQVQSQSDVDRLSLVWGELFKDLLPQGQTINQHIYKDILWCLMRSVREKRQELWDEKSWVLHHDNAPSHNALSIWEFLAKITLLLWINLLALPDLSPCDVFVSKTQRNH